MHRLLQGEVGSGKTVVALRAMLQVVDSGGQAALLAPTEVLAQQHQRSITAMLGDLAQGGLLGGAEGGDPGGAADRLAQRRRPATGARRGGGRRGRHRDRHARPARGARAVRRPRAGRRRRAAPLRGRAAGGAERQGRLAAARPRDDRDPDPADGRDDRLRRPRHLHARRAAGRKGRGADDRGADRWPSRGGSNRAWERVREEVAAGSPGVRRVRADRPGRGQRRPARRPAVAGRRGAGSPARGRRARRAAGGDAARPDAAGGEGPDDAGLRPRARSRCWSRRPSSRSASTCPTPP